MVPTVVRGHVIAQYALHEPRSSAALKRAARCAHDGNGDEVV